MAAHLHFASATSGLTKMQAICKACVLNNEGVELLSRHKVSKASAAFQTSLSIVKKLVNHYEGDEAIEDVCSIDSAAATAAPQLIQSCTIYKESDTELPELKSSYGFVYNRPIVLRGVSCHQDLEACLPLYSAILLFNLALVCHVQGRIGPEIALSRSCLLYRMSLQLLENASACTRMASFAAPLAMICLNNRAQILYEQCDYLASRRCLLQMSNIMNSCEDVRTNLNGHVMEGMILNVLLLDPPTAAQAA